MICSERCRPRRPVPETARVKVPLLGATVEIPVTSPLALTVTTGIAPVPPKVPTLELTVANVVAVFVEETSPDKLGIFVVVSAVPTNDVAVTTPETNTSPTTVSFDVGFVVPTPTLPET